MHHSTISIRLAALSAAVSLCFPVATSAQGYADDVVAMQVRGDIYSAGGMVDVTERVDGDLIVAGGTINVEAGVAGDVLVAGGQVEVKGSVKDDVRIVGGRVSVRGEIGGDLVVFGGEITVSESAKVAGDVVILGGSVVMNGVVSGNIRVESDGAAVAGEIKGNFTFRGNDLRFQSHVLGNATLVAQAFQASPQARVEGKVEYWFASGPQNFGSLAGGGAVYRAELEPVLPDVERNVAVGVGLGLLGLSAYGILATALFAIAVLLFTKTMFSESGKLLRKKPLRCAWMGFLWIALTPIVGALLCMTIIGIPMGLFVLVFYAFTVVFLKPIAALVIARALEDAWKQKWNFWMAFLWTMLVYVGLKTLMVIPILGWIAAILLCLAGFGAHAQVKWKRTMKIR